MTRPLPWRQRLRAVAFDFDGTLADTAIDFPLLRQQLADLIRRYGAWDQDLQGQYLLEMTDAAAARLGKAAGAALREEAEQLLRTAELAASAQAQLCDGAAEALARLRDAGLHIGVITRNCAEAVCMLLTRCPLPHDVLLTRDDVAEVKPSPRHLRDALAALEVAAHEALMVGDHRMDVECGKAAGTWTAGILCGSTTKEQFLEAGADLVLESIAALPDALQA